MGRSKFIFAFLVFTLISGVGCIRRPLEEPGNRTNVNVKVTTNAILNVSTKVYNDKIPLPEIDPEVMHVLFFEPDGENLITEAYISNRSVDSEGQMNFHGSVLINPGRYKLMIYNFGMETTLIRDYNKWSRSQAYTNSVSDNIVKAYKSKAPEDEIIAYEPDHLLLSVDTEVEIPYHEGEHTIHAEASTVIDTYYLQIMVDGLEYVSGASAFLTGMASGNVLSERKPVTEPQNTIYFNLLKSKDGDSPVICNVFNTFGHIPDKPNKLEVTFDLRTLDGRTIQKTFDITDVFKTPEAIENHWLLIKEKITIDPPDNPGTGGGGMDPSVSDWEDENHDILI